MAGAFHETGPCSVDCLEPLEFIGKLIVNRQGCRIPARVGGESIMKNVEAAQILDVEKVGKITPQF
jgi:hypothetical protein